jgi:DNA-binding MarR family transcriptional regulator
MSQSFRLYNLLKETFLLLDFGDRLLFEQFDLSVPRTYMLYHIADTPGISPSQLSDRMFCDKSNITRLVQGLETDGLVARRPHEHDGRATRLHLTPAGAALAASVAVAHRSSVEDRLRPVDEAVAAGMATTLAQLNRELAAALAAGKNDSEAGNAL